MEALFEFVQKHAVLLGGALGILVTLIWFWTRSHYKRYSEIAARVNAIASERPLDDQKLRKTNFGTHGSGAGSDE